MSEINVTIKLFASLRETLQQEETQLHIPAGSNVSTVWQTLTQQAEIPNTVFAAVNQEHAHGDTSVQEGDEIAFFPQITGGQPC